MTDEELIKWARARADCMISVDRDMVTLLANRIEALIEESARRLALARSEGVARVEQFERNEALTEQLAAARKDAKEAEAYAEEVEADRKKTYEALLKVSRIHGEVEAKLEKAVEALEDLVRDCEADYPPSHGAIKYFARATLAEIKGESHETLP